MNHTIKLKGKDYPVKFSLRSIKLYEKLTGRNLLQENYMEITNMTLGVDCLVAFVFCSLHVEKDQKLDITVEDLELNMGFDYDLFNVVIQAYIDFVPGLRKIYEAITDNKDVASRIEEAKGDPEKLRNIYTELVSPNGKVQAEA